MWWSQVVTGAWFGQTCSRWDIAKGSSGLFCTNGRAWTSAWKLPSHAGWTWAALPVAQPNPDFEPSATAHASIPSWCASSSAAAAYTRVSYSHVIHHFLSYIWLKWSRHHTTFIKSEIWKYHCDTPCWQPPKNNVIPLMQWSSLLDACQTLTLSVMQREWLLSFWLSCGIGEPCILEHNFLEEKLICYGWVHTSKGLEPDMWWLVKGVGLCEKEWQQKPEDYASLCEHTTFTIIVRTLSLITLSRIGWDTDIDSGTALE